MRHYDGEEDDRHDDAVVRRLDDETEAREIESKRNAAGTSPEILSIQDAFAEGQRATDNDVNPFQDGTPEYDAWERGRCGALTVRAAGLVA